MKTTTNIRSKEIILSDSLFPSIDGGGGNLEELLKSFSDKLSEIESAMAGIQKLKIGSIIMYSGADNDVEDFLLCDGAAVSRTNYADLFAVIGTTFGDGDGSTTFNLPNMIGRFPEGASTVGTVKDAGLPNLVGSSDTVGFSDTRYEPTGCFYPAEEWNVGTFNIVEKTGTAGANVIRFDASHGNPIYGNSTTVQPAALTLKYMIKYQ